MERPKKKKKKNGVRWGNSLFASLRKFHRSAFSKFKAPEV